MKNYFFSFLIFLCSVTFAQVPLTQNRDCDWNYQIINEFNGKVSRALLPELLFSYTPQSQDKFFVENEYIECFANVSEQDGKLLLQMKIIYQDLTAEEQVGTISAGSTMNIVSLKGSTISLTTYKGSNVKKKDGFTIFECNYSIPDSFRKNLKKTEVDHIVINFSKGFYDFEVYYLDFFKDQLNCFN
jgi:hypothetical protein